MVRTHRTHLGRGKSRTPGTPHHRRRPRGLFKSRNTPTPHQLDNGPTSGKNKRIKSLQITSSHTGRTVAPPAYNRTHTSAIHRATDSPHRPHHLGKTRRKAASAHPSPGAESDLALSSTQPHRRTPRRNLQHLPAHHLKDPQHR